MTSEFSKARRNASFSDKKRSSAVASFVATVTGSGPAGRRKRDAALD
jgi:hypothetical protein